MLTAIPKRPSIKTAHTYAHTHVHAYTHTHPFIHKRIHVYTHTRLLIYTRTHIHTYVGRDFSEAVDQKSGSQTDAGYGNGQRFSGTCIFMRV